VLVGGSTRMPCVREAVRDYFGREPFCRFLEGRLEPALQATACNHIEESVEMYWALAALCGSLLLYRFWRESARRPRRL